MNWILDLILWKFYQNLWYLDQILWDLDFERWIQIFLIWTKIYESLTYLRIVQYEIWTNILEIFCTTRKTSWPQNSKTFIDCLCGSTPQKIRSTECTPQFRRIVQSKSQLYQSKHRRFPWKTSKVKVQNPLVFWVKVLQYFGSKSLKTLIEILEAVSRNSRRIRSKFSKILVDNPQIFRISNILVKISYISLKIL